MINMQGKIQEIYMLYTKSMFGLLTDYLHFGKPKTHLLSFIFK
jgi:hypothetical protein